LRLKSGISGLGPIPNSNPKGTLLFDAVYLAAHDQLAGQVGRKVLVLITDGADQGSHYKVREAIEEAHRADTIIYSIYYVDPQMYGGFGAPSNSDLKKMSEETGGRLFEVGRRQSLQQIFDAIQEEMRSQYTVAYSSSNSERDGGFRKIEIKPKDKNVRIQARKGYFAASDGAK
jgi:VWFA-related protein